MTEYANNSHIRDFKSSGGTVIQDFSEHKLEYTFFLRNEKEISNFLENMKNLQTEILGIKNKLNFLHMRANFNFGDGKKVTSNVLKKVVDFQANCFDEIIIKLVDNNLQIMKEVFEYSKNKYNGSISLFLDIGIRTPMLIELMNYFSQITPDKVIWKYRKIDSNIEKYRYISKSLSELNIKYSLSECNKRCSIKGFEEVSISAIAKNYFGFEDCCFRYNYPRKSKGFPQEKLDKFNLDEYSWESQNRGDYYSKRLIDFTNLNKIKKSKSEINKRQKIKSLFGYLDNL